MSEKHSPPAPIYDAMDSNRLWRACKLGYVFSGVLLGLPNGRAYRSKRGTVKKDYFPWSYEPNCILVEIEFLVRAAASLVLLEENIIINIIVIINVRSNYHSMSAIPGCFAIWIAPPILIIFPPYSLQIPLLFAFIFLLRHCLVYCPWERVS